MAPTVRARELNTRELINAQLVLTNPRKRFLASRERKISMSYCIGELCWYLGGRQDLKSIAAYSKFWEGVSDDGVLVNSAYGYRLFKEPNASGLTQFDYALDVLIKDRSSRKAVMVIYSPDDARESKDNPCTLSLQFLIRGGKLLLFVAMRSNDVWLGLPYDLPFFTLVQEIMCVALQGHYPLLTMGAYTHTVVSLHAYQKDWQKVEAIGRAAIMPTIEAPELTREDVNSGFDDLLTYERSRRGVVSYKDESVRTDFQDWCKQYLD
jgi:thymidylate synthase